MSENIRKKRRGSHSHFPGAGSYSAETQNARPQVTKKPAAKSPVAKTPNAKSPVAKTPNAKSPVAKTPVRSHTPGGRSARPNHGRPDPASAQTRKKSLYRKSKYYRQRQQRLRLCLGLLALLLLAMAILLLRSCSTGQDAQMSGPGTVSDEASQNESEDSSDIVHMETNDGSAKETDSNEETAASVREPVSLTVSVVGDCTLGTDEAFAYSTSMNAYYDNYGKDYFFQNVRGIFEADDLTIANMEGALTDSTQRLNKLFAFKAPPAYAGILSSGSVEAVNLANNHSSDYGEQSLADTKTALEVEGILHFGYEETVVTEIKGVKVGLVGIYELYDHLGREQQLQDNIARVKEEGAELIIVIFHWGNEKETVPDSNQTTLGRMAIDEGADLVCGHHPHVLQGIETYKGKNIVYSLGNFCFGGNSAPSDTDTMIFQQTFTITADGVQAENVTNIIPCSVSSVYGYNNYQPTPAEGSEADRILEKIRERSSWIDTPDTSSSGA